MYHSQTAFYLREFQTLLDQLQPPLVICGDLNAHNPLWGSNHLDTKGKVIDSLLETTDLVLLNDGSGTRINNNGTFSSLDISMVSYEIATKCSWQVHNDSFGSDHLPIFISFFESPIEVDTSGFPKWNFKRADWLYFSSLCALSISESIITEDVDQFNATLTSCIINAANRSIPILKFKRKKCVPWWNEDCKVAKSKRQKAYNKLKRTSNPQDYIEYKKHCAIVKRVTKQARRTYWRSYCSSITKDSSIPKIWRTVKRMSNVYQPFSYPNVTNSKGQHLSETHDKATAFADHFASVSSDDNYTDEFKRHKRQFEFDNNDILLSSSESPDVYNEDFSMVELKNALSCTSESSPGADRIHYTVLKYLPETSLTVILELFNLVWRKQNIPQSWKHSIVIPIRKTNKDPSCVLSYRPIALTSCLCKLMERMVNSRMQWFLEKNNLISETQSGFRKSRSTTEPIVRLETAAHKAFFLHEYLISVSLDFEKAYDMLWINGLIYKLNYLGIRGNMFGFICSFLKNRTFQVRLHQYLSKVVSSSNGIPQGSVISPTLFNIMVNDLNDVVENCELSQFADDSSIWSSFGDIWTARRMIENDLENIVRWCNSWGFKLSETKTVAMVFTRRIIPNHFKIFLGNIPLNIVSSMRLLGVVFDRRLTWSKHIDHIVEKCKKILNLLKCLTGTDWGGQPKQMMQLYRTLVRSRLDYGCQVYGSASKSVLNKLNTIQATGLRLCLGTPRTTPTEALQVETGEMPLDLRREQLSTQYRIRTLGLKTTHPLNDELSTAWLYFARQAMGYELRNAPFIVRVNQNIAQLPLQYIEVNSISPVPFPPWHLHSIEVSLELQKLCPKSNIPYISKAISTEYIEREYSQFICMYTDGSKLSDGKTGAAFVVPELKISKGFKLPNHVSVFTCELVGILMALFWLLEMRPFQAIIFTDSLSAIQALIHTNRHSRNLILEILRMYSLLLEIGTAVKFVWIPSHVGIQGNEQADKVAETATQGSIMVDTPYTVSEIGSLVKRQLMSKWQNRWDMSTHGRYFYGIKKHVSREMSIFGNTRRDKVIFAKLRLDQCNLKARLHLIGKHSTGRCGCGVLDTAYHYLFGCFRYSIQRANLVHKLTAMHIPLGPQALDDKRAIPAILDYVKDTGKYYEL